MTLALFDLDDTLLDRQHGFREWASDFAKHYQLGADAIDDLVARDDHGRTERTVFFDAVATDYRLRETTSELVAQYHVEYPTYLRLFDSVLDALAELRGAGWTVGIVTNGPATQQRKIDLTGLGPFVDAVCVSALVGHRKPERAIFVEAARRCGAALEGWMVGDTPDADIAGGQNAGLRTAWVQSAKPWPDDLAPADLTVKTAVEAIATILRG